MNTRIAKIKGAINTLESKNYERKGVLSMYWESYARMKCYKHDKTKI
jgi:hypothetical protein